MFIKMNKEVRQFLLESKFGLVDWFDNADSLCTLVLGQTFFIDLIS